MNVQGGGGDWRKVCKIMIEEEKYNHERSRKNAAEFLGRRKAHLGVLSSE